MTLLLASVDGPAQAEDAVARGVDIIDMQGAPSPERVRAVLAAVAGRRSVSAGASEAAQAEALADAGAEYVRVLSRHSQDIVAAASPLTRRAGVLGIMLAEDGIEESAIAAMEAQGFVGVILNTTSGKNLLDALDITALADFIDMVRAHGMMAGLAGALEPPDVPRLLLLDPDILAFRFDAATIDGIRALIPPDQRRARAKPAKVDYRLAAPRTADVRKELDRIFVHDFVLSMRIGTYTRERDELQQVRFSVDVSIARPSDVPADMRDVMSYDVITDSIRMIAARGHIALAETLAEQVAAAVLAHPRAANVTVRVEKLDTGSGSVGVEIVRHRPAEAASVHQLYSEADPKASG
ncbi:MAG TPA: (5-formylfuran-3-yl)methyl phosphate synthase [Xanthobacteraceae bacterium]|nr:(5-formylfuran-3-yl)methyl phosphate synthase [Xanthobacteraceae bacterium]